MVLKTDKKRLWLAEAFLELERATLVALGSTDRAKIAGD